MKTYRYYGKGFRTFRIVGYALLWVSAVILCAVVWDILLETSEREMQNRRDALVAKGYLSAMPELSKKHKLRDCVIRDEKMICEKFVNGERLLVEISK